MEQGSCFFRGRDGKYCHLEPPDLSTHHKVQAILRDGDLHPPNNTMEVDALRMAWASCPANCIPLVLGDLNINFE